MFERFKNNKILLYVGRVSLQKGAIDLINSFATVVKYFPKTVLVIAGEFESMLLQKINDEIRGNLVLLGTIPHKELCHWYQVADWGVIPSYYEQCSYTGIEMKNVWFTHNIIKWLWSAKHVQSTKLNYSPCR